MKTPAQRGFTLIEVMIVVAVAAILAAFALPEVKDMLVTGAVRSASSDMYASLLAARSEAIKRRANATVAPIGTTWNTGWTVTVGGTTFQKTDALRTDVSVVTIPTASPHTPIVYGYNGRVSSGNQTVVFYSTTQSRVQPRCLSVDTNGLPRVRMDTNKTASDGCN